MAHIAVTAPLPRTMIITKDDRYYRWRYEEEPESRSRQTGVRANISRDTAVAHIEKEWKRFHRGRVLFVKTENIC